MINKGLVIALLIAVFGLIGFVVWQNYQIEQSSKVANQNSQVSPVPQDATPAQEDISAPNGGFINDSPDEYFLIPELRIGFKKVPELDLTYAIIEDELIFTSNVLKKAAQNDPTIISCVTLQSLSISSVKEEVFGGGQIALADGRYINYVRPHEPCYYLGIASAKGIQLVEGQFTLFSKFLDSVQSY
jgi:hypothetical protein